VVFKYLFKNVIMKELEEGINPIIIVDEDKAIEFDDLVELDGWDEWDDFGDHSIFSF
jgi:hypothetical protein